MGVAYPIEQVVSIRPGMSEDEVIKLLAKPYAEEKDLDENVVLHYEYVATNQTALAVGLFVVGVTGTQSRSGGKCWIILDPTTRTVKKVYYEIYGAERYQALRGERHDESQ